MATRIKKFNAKKIHGEVFKDRKNVYKEYGLTNFEKKIIGETITVTLNKVIELHPELLNNS